MLRSGAPWHVSGEPRPQLIEVLSLLVVLVLQEVDPGSTNLLRPQQRLGGRLPQEGLERFGSTSHYIDPSTPKTLSPCDVLPQRLSPGTLWRLSRALQTFEALEFINVALGSFLLHTPHKLTGNFKSSMGCFRIPVWQALLSSRSPHVS